MLMDFFVPLLYLHNNGAIAMSQEEFFGEIMIKIIRRERTAPEKAVS